MLINRFILALFVFSFLMASEENNYIRVSLDSFGESDLLLDRINPYRQANLKLGLIDVGTITNIPYASNLMDFNFINLTDSLGVTSQFNYSRGDYSLRETKLIVNNRLNSDSNLTFKAHGRKYPGMYNTLGDEYVLQNYLIDYIRDDDEKYFRLSKYYHEEDVGLPSNPYAQIPERLVTVDGLGFNFQLTRYAYSLELEYQSKFFKVDRDIDDAFLDYGLQENNYKLNFSQNLLDNLYLTLNAGYEEVVSDDLFSTSVAISQNKLGLFLIRRHDNLNQKLNLFFNSINVNPESSNEGGFIESYSEKDFLFRYHLTYERMNSIKWGFILGKSHNVPILYENNQVYYCNEEYYSASFIRNDENSSFELTAYNIDIEAADISSPFSDSGNMLRLAIGLEKKDLILSDSRKFSFFDMLNISMSYNNYFDYSPVDFNVQFRLRFKYLNKIDNYIPYIDYHVNQINFNQGYGIELQSSTLINYANTSNYLSYYTSKIELGLIFEDFKISYNILNPGKEYYFLDTLSDIELPIYQMNYLTIKWQFFD